MNINFLKKQVVNCIIGALFCAALYLLFNNLSKYQGWGGDYAGYMDQARSIVEGRNTTTPNYLYNPEMPTLAPPSYPMGFPLLLSPFYKIFGLNTLAYVQFMSVLWWLCGFSLFFLLKTRFPILPSAIVSLLFLFNPYYFAEKNGILPDSFFTICIIWAIYLFINKNPKDIKSAFFCGFLVGFSIITRANGITLLLAMLVSVTLELAINSVKNKQIKINWDAIKRMGFIVISAFIVIIGVKICLPGPSGGSYFDQVSWGKNFYPQFKINFLWYRNTIDHFFCLEEKMPFMYKTPFDFFWSKNVGFVAIVIAFLGIFGIKGKEERFLVLFIFVFSSILWVWPNVQGFRYVLPVLPIYIYFLMSGLQKINAKIPFGGNYKWLVFPILLLPTYYKINKETAGFFATEENGAPEYSNNQEAYQYVRENLPKESIFAYHHPLIFGFYTDRKCVTWQRIAPAEKKWETIVNFKVDYLLINNWQLDNDKDFKEVLKKYDPKLDTVWTNERNVLYKVVK
jgi:4-amino-4-deoxy-L-arabinose transferase-like glycosyltransferase